MQCALSDRISSINLRGKNIMYAEYKRFEDKNKELVIKLEGISRELHTWEYIENQHIHL